MGEIDDAERKSVRRATHMILRDMAVPCAIYPGRLVVSDVGLAAIHGLTAKEDSFSLAWSAMVQAYHAGLGATPVITGWESHLDDLQRYLELEEELGR